MTDFLHGFHVLSVIIPLGFPLAWSSDRCFCFFVCVCDILVKSHSGSCWARQVCHPQLLPEHLLHKRPLLPCTSFCSIFRQNRRLSNPQVWRGTHAIWFSIFKSIIQSLNQLFIRADLSPCCSCSFVLLKNHRPCLAFNQSPEKKQFYHLQYFSLFFRVCGD